MILYRAGDGNDSINCSGNNVKVSIEGLYSSVRSGDDIVVTVEIDGNDGADNITNNGSTVTVNGGEGDDTIINNSDTDNVKINGGAGNDSISTRGSQVSINGGAGKDSISNDGNNSTLIGGEDDDTIQNWGANSKIEGDTGNDSVQNYGGSVTISGGAGKNIIVNSGSAVSITGGDGSDTISNGYYLDDYGDSHAGGTGVTMDGGAGNDFISSDGDNVTIDGSDGNDNIVNWGANSTILGGEGNDSINVDASKLSLSGGAGDDFISLYSGEDITVNGGTGNDTIKGTYSSDVLFQYRAGDGNDIIQGFREDSTLSIGGGTYSSEKSGNDIIVSVGEGKITLQGATWWLSKPNIIGKYAPLDLTVANSKVNASNSYVVNVGNAYQYNAGLSVLNIKSALEDIPVKITNAEDSAVNARGAFGSAILSNGNVLEYQMNSVALTSETFNDKISFSKDTTFNYGEIQVDLLKGSVISTKGEKEISFDNNSSANITAPEGAKININAGTFTINNLPVNSANGKGIITVEKDGLSFKGYGVQFVDLEVAKESYFGKLMPMTVAYNSADDSYTLQNATCVKTLSDDFKKLTFDISAAEDYAYYEVNDKEFLVSSVADNLNVVETDGSTFKIQGKEIDAEKIGCVTLDEQITFSGTEIDFDGVKVNYALNKPAIYSLDGKEISISDAATVTTSDETKTFTCEAGSYIVNGRSFETSADLTFTADANEIQIPLTDAKTEIYFDGVKASGISDGGEIVFDLANDKISIPNGAELNVTSPEEVKLNLAAGNFTIDNKKISTDNALEIIVDKNDLKVPLSENAVTINGAAITGNGEMTIDNTDARFFSILLPDGALVENVSNNTFELNGKNSSAYFGDTNKKVLLTEDGTAYVRYREENKIDVGFNTLMFENVEIQGNDAWTVETSGTTALIKSRA